MFGWGRKKLSYTCACCGETYSGSPSLAYKRPVYYFWVPEEQREARVRADDDVCHIAADPDNADGHDIYAIRCTLDIPIKGVAEPFCWGLWVSQSKDSFERYVRTFNQDQSQDGSSGWLAVDIPYYRRNAAGEPLESLACNVKWCTMGQRPKIEVMPCDHPLYIDQANGIEWDKAVEIAQSHMRIAHAKT